MLNEKQRRKMRAGQPGPQPAKSAGPAAKLRASGPRARSKSRPADKRLTTKLPPHEKTAEIVARIF